jgi:hypothetical protein
MPTSTGSAFHLGLKGATPLWRRRVTTALQLRPIRLASSLSGIIEFVHLRPSLRPVLAAALCHPLPIIPLRPLVA